MPQYVVNKQLRGGYHEVHVATCAHGPDFMNRHDLGFQPDCRQAVVLADQLFRPADGCKFCCPECHKG